MVWADWAVWVALVAMVVAIVQMVRLRRKNRRLQQLAAEANRLRREADEASRRNRQLKQEMTSNIAHELKTPVSSIRGYLEILLSDKPVEPDRQRHFLERSYRQTIRLSELILDVSVINKLEESADLFPRAAEDVRVVAQEAIDDLTDQSSRHGIVVHNHLPQYMPLQGNHELLFCIFRNLTENSISYAGEGADVVVETYKDAVDSYYIHFYDTGRGVPDEYLSRLFDRFVRIGEGRSRTDGGTGLGLSIVKHAVLFHGGEIYAKNRSEGGLEFFFSLKK